MSKDWLSDSYGFSHADWDAGKDKAVGILRDCAQRRQTISYSGLAAAIGDILPGLAVWPEGVHKMSALLGQVFVAEWKAGRPPLPAMAVHANDPLPGKGFWRLPEMHLGIDTGKDDAEKIMWWLKQQQRCIDYYRRAA